MSLLLLDTTFLIDAERNAGILNELIDDDDNVAIAAITMAELAVGVQLAKPRQRSKRQAFLDDVVASIPILPYDEAVAFKHANLLVAVRRAGRPRGAHDLIIAATALSLNYRVATRDMRSFPKIRGLDVVRW